MPLFTITQLPPGPASGAFVITPSDTQKLPFDTRGVYVGAAGNLAVVMANEDVLPGAITPRGVTFQSVPAGSLLPIAAKYILSTGTTAGSLVGVY